LQILLKAQTACRFFYAPSPAPPFPEGFFLSFLPILQNSFNYFNMLYQYTLGGMCIAERVMTKIGYPFKRIRQRTLFSIPESLNTESRSIRVRISVTVDGFKGSVVQGCFSGPSIQFWRPTSHKGSRIGHFKPQNRQSNGRILPGKCCVTFESGRNCCFCP
jgi:hypothetical protein